MALLAPPTSYETGDGSGPHRPLIIEDIHAPLDGGYVEGTLFHHGSFTKLAAIVPGYLGIEKGYKPLARYLADLDDDLGVATYEPVRTQPQRGMWVSRFTSPLLVPHRLLGQSGRAVIEHVASEQSGVKKISLIGHSTGGPGALNAANHADVHVNNVILLASAGVTGHTFLSLLPKGPLVLWEGVRNRDRLVANLGEESADFFIESVRDLVHYAFTNPARTGGEAIAVGQCKAFKSIDKARSLGVRVGGLFFENDAFFPGAIANRLIGGKIDAFVSLGQDMGHLAPQTHTPEIAHELTNQLAYLSQITTARAMV